MSLLLGAGMDVLLVLHWFWWCIVAWGEVAAIVASAALSVFALLTGLGSWLAGSLPPTWLPHRAVWIAELLALGAALVPVWWRLAFRPTPARSR